jgi:RNA polymerase sigma-70 factor (ECF subfamily)
VEFQTFDAAYLEKLRDGEEQTERHFVTYFSELITLKLRSRLQSPQAIEDVKQETFTRAFTLLRTDGGVRSSERLGSLVNSICNHVLLEHYRASGRAQPLEEEVAVTLLDRRTDALTEMISRERRDAVHEVLETLGDRERTVLRSVFVEERDKDQVCKELGIDRNYMRVLVHRAKQAFREKYERRAAPVGSTPGKLL